MASYGSESELPFASILQTALRLKGNYCRANSSGQRCAGDAVCIDRSSSAELLEAINFMFRWYANSVVCFVHLQGIKLE